MSQLYIRPEFRRIAGEHWRPGGTEITDRLLALGRRWHDAGAEGRILDVGCGSGILSICGALLGSREILGIEIDEDAVRVAHENVEENHVEDAVKVMQGDLTKGVDFKADVIVANLMADLVMLLSEDARKHLTEDGIFISSGILVEKEEMVSAAIREAGFRIVEIAEDGEWCAIASVPEV